MPWLVGSESIFYTEKKMLVKIAELQPSINYSAYCIKRALSALRLISLFHTQSTLPSKPSFWFGEEQFFSLSAFAHTSRRLISETAIS
jgi:hypothetical protein